MTSLLESTPTDVTTCGYGVVFQFGEPSPGARVGCVYLLRKPNVLDREESYYVTFRCEWSWDDVHKYWFLGHLPEIKRELTAEEVEHFEGLLERELV